MATMIPGGIEEFKTEGERRFYRFLEAVAKPDREFTTWYLPDIEGREPDFILFGSEVGLLIFEVKDWALAQIVEANPHTFTLKVGERHEPRKNPMQQARKYLESLMDRIKEDGRLVSQDAQHYGKPKIPIGVGVVFPNISRQEYQRHKLDAVIDPGKVFFWDHLHAASDIVCDVSGHCFRKTLLGMFPPLFRFSLTGPEYHHLKQLLFPVVRIQQPERNICAYLDPTERATVLDDEQEAIARRCCGGHHLVVGPSGSGKTLVLVQKAAFLKQYNPAIRSVLFLCYNVSLVNYIKRLLAEKGVSLGLGRVEVHHFFELCAKVLGEEIHYEKEEADYYDLVVEETLKRLRDNRITYDAVLVDEGQDFTGKMQAVVRALVNSQTENVTVGLDEGQNIYRGDLLWGKGAGAMPVRIDRLSTVYRNTCEIREFASRFSGETPPVSGTLYCETHGPGPELRRLGDLDKVADYVAEVIKALHAQGDYPLSEMAVLYARKSSRGERRVSIHALLSRTLEARGIMSTWMAEDYRSKRSYDITTESVTISTIHSAKGLDYACVFLVGLDEIEPDGWPEQQVRNLVYVGITRARHRLFIPYVAETEVISELCRCL
jgi:hypothetical protein